MVGETLGLIERCGPTDVVLQQPVQLCGEAGIIPGLGGGLLQLRQSRHEGLGNVLATETTETTVGTGTNGWLQAGRIRSAGRGQGAGHGSTVERWISVSRQS